MENTLKQAFEQISAKEIDRLLDENSQLPESEKLKLNHELQLHQIELEMQMEELKQSDQTDKYANLYEYAPSSYFTLSEQGIILGLNLAATKILAMERILLQNKQLSQFISKDSKAFFESFLQRIFKSGSTEFCEVTFHSYNNSQYPVYLSGITKKDLRQCYVTAIDISEQKKQELELSIAKDKAGESDRLKAAFLQNICHEIRSPLNAIKGFSQLLTKHYDNKERLKQYVEIIDQRSDDLLSIIDNLIDISKIESGQLKVNIETLNLYALFEDLKIQFQEVQNKLNKKHIYFYISIDTPLPIIKTDPNKLKQILVNLLTNAFRFTSKGQIIAGCRPVGDNLAFFVSDTGIGIPLEKQKVIFDRFIQIDQEPNQNLGGTGLGLSIVQGLVSLLGGCIFVESEPGKGSTFSFIIPKHKSVFIENPDPK